MNNSEDRKLDSQVLGYFERLLESKAKNDKGKLLNIQKQHQSLDMLFVNYIKI